MIDTTLIDRLTVLANKEKKIKLFKRRLRIKGKITEKGTTKKGNITLKVKKGHVCFNTDLVKIKVNIQKAESIFKKALKVLEAEIPAPSEECGFCKWAEECP